MLIIEKDGKTTQVSGWRAWLLAFGVVLAVAATLSLLAFLLVGLALAIGAVLLIVVPITIGVAILASLFSRRP